MVDFVDFTSRHEQWVFGSKVITSGVDHDPVKYLDYKLTRVNLN